MSGYVGEQSGREKELSSSSSLSPHVLLEQRIWRCGKKREGHWIRGGGGGGGGGEKKKRGKKKRGGGVF